MTVLDDGDIVANLGSFMSPPTLASLGIGFPEEGRIRSEFNVSACLVRRSDEKCLHLFTGLHATKADSEAVSFNEEEVWAEAVSTFANPRDGSAEAYEWFKILDPVFGGDFHADGGRLLHGFDQPLAIVTRMRLFTGEPPVDGAAYLAMWHASLNWV